MKEFEKNIIPLTYTIKKALETLNGLKSKDSLTLFIVDTENKLVGTLTDGDIRRGLLEGRTILEPVASFMHTGFRFLERNKIKMSDVEELRRKEIELIPLLNDRHEIIKIIDLSRKRAILPVDALIMAGGEGKRLRPLTEHTPKPLLKVGDKPIIEHTIDRLNDYGVDTLYISINYLGEQLESYFGDGSAKNIRISYVNESAPLGTIGALSLIEKIDHDYVLVMNSDLLTNIDFDEFYKTCIGLDADMAVASIPYHMSVPYAVFELDNERILSLKEKPTFTHYSNAGIYLIKKKHIALIPRGEFYNATDLMDRIISLNLKLVNYPILGYWLDIGRHEDYLKAQDDIKHIKL
jgi:dTDP-glucose pyrophosphorylase